jgi:LuxR family maltose regulon positive regulatory protein
LLFTKEESAEFIRLTTGNPLKEMDADTLTKLTEGWATGIQMAALSLKDRLDVSTFLREFSGTNRYVLDYLVEEVLETQSDQTQTFLYRTSILERMSGPLCDALLTSQSHDPDAPGFEPGDGQRFLMDLERQNLFIIPLDEQRRWYRYHHLFADLLQQRLETHHPELASQLHQQAADWYREQGLFPDAIRHSLACGDYNTAVETIAAVAEEAMMRSDFIKLKGWIDRLPDDVMADHPRLYAYHLIISIFSGIPADEVSQRFELIRKLERKGEIQGDILALQAMLAVYNQDIRGSAQYAEQALKILPEDSLFFRSTLAGFLGYAYLMYGDTDAAKRTLAESAHVSARAGNLTMQVLALCHLAEIDIIEGRLPKADAHYRLAIDTGLTADGKPRPILGLAFIGQGMAQFEQGQFDEAYENLKQGVELIQKWTPSGAIQGYIFMAWIHQLRGEEASADTLIETATELARRFEPLEEDDKYVRYQRAKMQTVRGNPTQALRLYSISPEISEKDLDRLFPPIDPDSLAGFTNLVSYMATGEAFLALGQHEVAERLISRARVVSQERGWKRVDMAFMTTLAEVHTQCGREDQALETMAEALEIAAEGGYVSDFIERGRRICGLLREALRAGIQPEFVAQLLSRIEAQDTGEAPSSPAEKASLMMIEPLSERELEVLSLVAKGHTNPEIASHLVVAVTTVKKHVSNILGKLGVSSREEAAGRGRELGLF